MKSVAVVAFTFLLLPVASSAQPQPLTREALALILGKPAAASSCAPAPAKAMFAAQKSGDPGGSTVLATCTATCETGSVQCSGSSCTADNRNCSVFERGHVSCDGTTYWCPTACPSADYCYNCAQTGSCVDCCRCDGGGVIMCNNCCACEATADCFACCRCKGGNPTQCALACG